VLLIYEISRLFILVLLFSFYSPLEGAIHLRVFPYIAMLSPNVIFPMITFFLYINFSEYRNFLPLYLAGKFIMITALSVWIILSLTQNIGDLYMGQDQGNIYNGIILLLGSVALSITDMLSLTGSCYLLIKTRPIRLQEAGLNGGL